jgi:hypothetical protein
VVNFSPAALELLLAQAQLQIHAACRFSLRDNPAALASSIAVGIDPVGRMGRGSDAGRPVVRALLDFVYLGLFAAALPFAALESAFGRGATLWVAAGKCVESAATKG